MAFVVVDVVVLAAAAMVVPLLPAVLSRRMNGRNLFWKAYLWPGRGKGTQQNEDIHHQRIQNLDQECGVQQGRIIDNNTTNKQQVVRMYDGSGESLDSPSRNGSKTSCAFFARSQLMM